jgi:hypothetical protein
MESIKTMKKLRRSKSKSKGNDDDVVSAGQSSEQANIYGSPRPRSFVGGRSP